MYSQRTKTTLRLAASMPVRLVVFCFVLGAIFTGCLDIPTEPSSKRQVEYIKVYLAQTDAADSSILKVRPNESATLNVDVYPRQYRTGLTFQWLYVDSLRKDTSTIGQGNKFTIKNTSKSKIPNVLKASDQEGNILLEPFLVIVNTPPVFKDKATPAPNETFYGNSQTSFFFHWEAEDDDKNAIIQYIVIFDEQQVNVGTLNQIYQSGFSEGKHTFGVIATDNHGDSDTLFTREFFVTDTLGGIR